MSASFLFYSSWQGPWRHADLVLWSSTWVTNPLKMSCGRKHHHINFACKSVIWGGLSEDSLGSMGSDTACLLGPLPPRLLLGQWGFSQDGSWGPRIKALRESGRSITFSNPDSKPHTVLSITKASPYEWGETLHSSSGSQECPRIYSWIFKLAQLYNSSVPAVGQSLCTLVSLLWRLCSSYRWI